MKNGLEISKNLANKKIIGGKLSFSTLFHDLKNLFKKTISLKK